MLLLQDPVGDFFAARFSLLRVRSDLIHLLQKHYHQTHITVADVYAIRRSYRGQLDQVERLFRMAADMGAGEVIGSIVNESRRGGRNPNSLRLRLTLQAMSADQREALRIVVAGGPRSAQGSEDQKFQDFGSNWAGLQNCCVPIHLVASVAQSCLGASEKARLFDAAWNLAQEERLPLDITPRQQQPPKTLEGFHALLCDLDAALVIHYVTRFGGLEIQQVCLGHTDAARQLLPLYVSLSSQHCCLAAESEVHLHPEAGGQLWLKGRLHVCGVCCRCCLAWLGVPGFVLAVPAASLLFQWLSAGTVVVCWRCWRR